MVIFNKRNFKVTRYSFYYVDFVSRFLAWKCEMYQESTRCTSILFYTNKHDKIKNNCVVLENINLQINFIIWLGPSLMLSSK